MNEAKSIKRLTGKQKAFVDAYLGEARFNASRAAFVAGYKASTQHSFESIGSENLTRPCVREAIDTYFKMSRMTSEEVIIELTKLARGDSRDKLKALTVLSSHHGLLNGAGRQKDPIQESHLNQQIEIAISHIYGNVDLQVEAFNKQAAETEKRHEAQWRAVIDRYRDSPVAFEALTFLRDVIHGQATIELQPEPQPVEVEVIPPERRLQPAAVERMMRDIETTTRVPVSGVVIERSEPEPSQYRPDTRENVDGWIFPQ